MDIGYNEPKRDLTAKCEEFRSWLNTTIRAKSEATIETAISINFEVTTQIIRKLEELKRDLNSKIPSKLSKRDFRQTCTKGPGV